MIDRDDADDGGGVTLGWRVSAAVNIRHMIHTGGRRSLLCEKLWVQLRVLLTMATLPFLHLLRSVSGIADSDQPEVA